jgi:hypothetical protein
LREQHRHEFEQDGSPPHHRHGAKARQEGEWEMSGMPVKMRLLEVDFTKNTITLEVPSGWAVQMHYHPCDLPVDILQLIDKHDEENP